MAVTDIPVRFRDTGIDAVGAVPWGTHFCVFYESKADLVDLLVPYFKAGLDNDEFCMWVTSEPLKALEARDALATTVPDLDELQARGAIEILEHSEWYLQDREFDQQRVLDGWVQCHDDAIERGYAGLRLTGNTFWLERSLWRDFQDYEHVINEVIGRYRMIALCTYSLARCTAPEVVDVVQAHQFALFKREGEWVMIENSSSKQAAEAIRHLNEALERSNTDLATTNHELAVANEELAAFSYSVSHDLRAPLRAIGGFSEILLDDHADELHGEAAELLGRIVRNVGTMQQLVDDLLSLSRAGNQELTSIPVDMTALVSAVVADLQQAEPGRPTGVTVEPLDGASGDPALLRQVWVNLLSNAVKFTRDISTPEIRVSSEPSDREVAYHVHDNGAGFDMAYVENLFGAFQRLHGAEFPGTGIGLAIVKRIVTRHGGRVWAEGEPGHGASFSFTLPLILPPA